MHWSAEGSQTRRECSLSAVTTHHTAALCSTANASRRSTARLRVMLQSSDEHGVCQTDS